MRKKTKGKHWTLTIIRSGKDDFSSGLEHANYAFGRYSWEVSDPSRDASIVPSGLVEVVRKAEIVEEALETGFKIEMTTNRNDGEWTEFISVASKEGIVPWEPPRTIYSSSDNGLLEMITIFSCSSQNCEMPTRIWVRARSLPERELIWAIENELLASANSRQMKLDNWLDLPPMKRSIDPSQVIPLPGPSASTTGFFTSRGC